MRTPTIFLGVVLAGALLPAQPAAAASGPQLVRFHGGGYDQASAVAVDAGRNVYVAGAVDDPGGGATFAVVKFDPSGAVRWTARYDGSAGGVGGRAVAVAVDAAGTVYAAGWTSDGAVFGANVDQLVVSFSATGTQRWAHRTDGAGQGFDLATDIAVDAAGAVYVAGFTYAQGYDWLLRRYGSSGAVLWTRTHSGPGAADDRVAELAVTADGPVVAGFVKRADIHTNDLDTIAYDAAGGVRWARSFSDTAASHEQPQDLDVDAAGRVVVTGTTAESASPYVPPFPVTVRYDATGAPLPVIRAGGGAVDADPAGNLVLAGFLLDAEGNRSGNVSRYAADGTRSWSTPLTTAPEDVLVGMSVAFDGAGAVTLAGTLRDVFVHNDDIATIRYAPTGAELWRHRFNGPVGGDDQAAGLVVDAAGDAVVAGTSWNDYVSSGGTADDILLLRFAAGTAPALVAPSGLTATGVSASQIRLSWQDNTGVEDGYRIERCAGVGCTGFAEVAVVGHDQTTYLDTGLARNTPYTYRVRAFGGGGASAYSNTATGKTRKR